MSEVIVRLNSDHIKVKGAEYVRDLVRCKECKWAEPNREGDYDCKCHIPTFRITADDFCSRGEREGER